MKKLFASFVTGFTALSVLLNPTTLLANTTFKISAIPDYNATEMTCSFDSFADYLIKETGLEVQYVPVTDYAAVVTAFRRGEIDLVWFGGLTGVQARARVAGSEAIAQRPQDEKFQSVFIKQAALENVKDIKDVKGHTLAFGSESSTSGHLMPRFFLTEAGINPEKDLDAQPTYSGSHDKTYGLVEAGSVQIGAVNKQYWDKMVKEGKVDSSKVVLFYTTSEYYDYNWTINLVDKKFGEGTKEKVKVALLKADSASSEVMNLLSAEKFIATNNDNYNDIEKVAKELKLIK
ncbi:putative selenate ABC transporter substrate-binding protein [Testudinibacter sp. TR-2022]|uniref:putative selenate ABC transporter substrate-binding protein n=1 Tax=Testudinibacter sp. TR-2022 TaxID=2585029 RepID=UPI001119CE20|nr:putative selenate ABC transporter substrate-binding protein [Testudinibacter sp. TR-2022]TNH03934.1 putative selenate ABC transporter substrate-binding protein [Pasteurellaceae bacterium Phil31]TNH07656.1 putative selenate ABC transporter substrate-binding protein [Testudinibacter sp. TR-2022]TNH09862.1 putative selenate ABC transporter substrate-binding protein [Testudinibacter sp. TR-2022]TNH17286.1 putative selenate ABC transporter substrate-binding protein [Testudinibacter sp. TR-2022]T